MTSGLQKWKMLQDFRECMGTLALLQQIFTISENGPDRGIFFGCTPYVHSFLVFCILLLGTARFCSQVADVAALIRDAGFRASADRRALLSKGKAFYVDANQSQFVTKNDELTSYSSICV